MSQPIYLFSISSHSKAKHINALEVTFFKPNIEFSHYDYLIITSKQASKALAQYDKEHYIHKKALAISKQSAKSYEEMGGEILEIGSGYGDNLSKIIQSYPLSTRWLYLRAKVVASEFVFQCLQEGYNIDEKIVYESRCSKIISEVEVEEEAILIFTSPSSVECFLKTKQIGVKQKVIVIGKTTAKAIPKDTTPYIAKEPTIQSCFDTIEFLEIS